MKKILRYTLRIAGALMCLLLLVWAGLSVYVHYNKARLLQKATEEVKEHFGADISIGQLDISLFRHFPSVAFQLSDVSLRDSLWSRHHHDLLKVSTVYADCPLLGSLFSGKVRISKVSLEHGVVYFYRDSTGYSNTYVFKDRKPSLRGGKPENPPDISLTDIRWVQDLGDKNKLFDLDIHRLVCDMNKEGRVLQMGIGADITANSFSFNTSKGSFIKGRKLAGRFRVSYNTASKIVQFAGATIKIDGHPVSFTGRFFPAVSPDPFFLTIEVPEIPWHVASSLLTPGIQQKLDEYDIDRPVSVSVQLDAGNADDPQPQITVKLNLDKGGVLTPIGRFTETSFRASFTNEWIRGRRRGDDNSAIRLLGFSGHLGDLPLRSDTMTITNLKYPRLASDIHSHFTLDQLNDLTGSQAMRFVAGRGDLNVYYRGPMSENDTAGTVVNGWLDIDSAAVTYVPYQWELTGGKGRLLFKDQDMLVNQLAINAGKTNIRVKGIAKNLVALLDRNAENVSMDWNLQMAHMDLEDFSVLAGSTAAWRRVSAAGSGRSADSHGSLFGATFTRVDNLLKEGVVHVAMEASDISYRKFSGAHAKGDLLFDNQAITLNRLMIEQGTGVLQLKAMLKRNPGGTTNPLTLESHLTGVDLPRLFSDFNNFGQEALISRNLKGRLTADLRLSGALTGKAKVAPNSLKGTIDFSLKDGELIDFGPMETIHEKVLKKRDLSQIRFAELKNQLDVDSTTITIHRMEIQSTAFTLFAEGTYDLKTGPDMSLQVPLSNLKKDRNPDIPPDSKGNDSRAGISLRLRARNGDDGKLKISWDPFKKALKKKNR
ncbi:AsmA-like C-terminal region-containing protein [Puia sp. P3]|uniref:AsmA-like C-terminal region-containing protein n=1 Tax=Puia sp. P3 TaxID=3423952 RepID=UPI003D678301